MSGIRGNTIIANIELRRRLYDDIRHGTLAHAYIIEGKSGSGRHTLAKHIIAALACERNEEKLPCGECLSCRHIFEDKCPDVMTRGKEDKASVGIHAIRTLKNTISAVPNDLDFKAYIIEDADTLTMQAQNAFLLTLEQPPTEVFFFILCENARSLLETIRSRAAILRTEPIPHQEIGAFICSESIEKSIRDTARSFKNSQPSEFEGCRRKHWQSHRATLPKNSSADNSSQRIRTQVHRKHQKQQEQRKYVCYIPFSQL